jgi:hypothetical protein
MDLRRINLVLESVRDDLHYGYVTDAIEKLNELVRITPDVFAGAGLSIPHTRKTAARRAKALLKSRVRGDEPSWMTHRRSKAAALAGAHKKAKELGKEAHRNTINPPEHGSEHDMAAESIQNRPSIYKKKGPEKDDFDLNKYLATLAGPKSTRKPKQIQAPKTEADSTGRPPGPVGGPLDVPKDKSAPTDKRGKPLLLDNPEERKARESEQAWKKHVKEGGEDTPEALATFIHRHFGAQIGKNRERVLAVVKKHHIPPGMDDKAAQDFAEKTARHYYMLNTGKVQSAPT